MTDIINRLPTGHEWTHTKTIIQNCELEDGSQGDSCPTWMPWTPWQEEQEEDLQDLKRSTTTNPPICLEEDSYNEEEEEDIPNET